MLSLDTKPLFPGEHLGPYVLVALLARGGMGEVWLGARRDDGPRAGRDGDGDETRARGPVALKVILSSATRDDGMRRLFHEETRIATRLADEHVVRVLDHGEEGEILYYAMEWVDGVSLAELHELARRARRSLDRAVLARIVIDAAAGLHSAHELRDADGVALDVVHRDVSPENVLIARDGTVKVADFGIARARGRAARTTTGKFRGKLSYVSPEQVSGGDVDRRADVFALGAVLYEGLAGQAPFAAADDAAVLARLVGGSPPFIFDADVPKPLVALLRRALARHPSARYATAAHFADAVRAASDGVAEVSDVAAVIDELARDRLAARREELRHALSRAHAREATPIVPSSPADVSALASSRPSPATQRFSDRRGAPIGGNAPTSGRGRLAVAATLLALFGGAFALRSGGSDERAWSARAAPSASQVLAAPVPIVAERSSWVAPSVANISPIAASQQSGAAPAAHASSAVEAAPPVPPIPAKTSSPRVNAKASVTAGPASKMGETGRARARSYDDDPGF